MLLMFTAKRNSAEKPRANRTDAAKSEVGA